MKYVVFLGDGMADEPVPALGGKTPLEVSRHPAMDRLADRGTLGLVKTIPENMPKGSETANLSVMGYDPEIFFSGRSPLEAASIGVALDDDDVTYRCNLISLEGDRLETAVIKDHSAGEITTEEAEPFIKIMQERFNTDSVILHKGISFRHCLQLKHAETGAILVPPHDVLGQSVMEHLPHGAHSELMLKMIRDSFEAFRDHPVNQARRAKGLNTVDCVWFWGEGRKPRLTSFPEKYGVRGGVISAVDLLLGIAVCAGLDPITVPGGTGTMHTDYAAKGAETIRRLQTGCDFIYVHVEGIDEEGHHGAAENKAWCIEQFDEKVVAPVMEYLERSGQDFAVMALPDHPTPIVRRTHTGDPVPFALYRSGENRGSGLRFTETDAKKTGVYVERGCMLMDELLQKGEEK